MFFKRILKRDKKKKTGSESHRSPSRGDTPTPSPSIQSDGPSSVPSVAVSALVFNPFVTLPASPSPGLQQSGTSVNNTGNWTNLTAFLDLLHQTPLLSPLRAVMDDLSWFIRAHEDVINTRNEYGALRTQLEELFKDLRTHFSGSTPPAMTTSMLNLCEAIQTEIQGIYGTQDRNTISRYMQASQNLDAITGCYRRIQGHLERVMLNASLNIWKTVDRQAIEAQLGKLNPSLSAYYDSAEANIVHRRECAANTREQVLRDLHTWKDNLDEEKVCWINGMAGTGKTTIANTLCSTLDKNHELGASFFCTRLIPACRDVKHILPTIAYQLARFSSPFRSALLQVLEQDPDIHSKAPRVQFRRMIFEPLQQAMSSLPTRVVIVIDALDECDDGNGVEQILEILLESASKLPIKFLVSSRPEPHIRDRIHQSPLKAQLILHELDQKMVRADIETYLRLELAAMSTALTEDQLADLVERAGSLFIYAATVVRYIKGGDTLERLAAVLQPPDPGQEPSNQTKDIDQLYEVVLISALDSANLERAEKQRMQLVLHTVVCAQEPLTVDALAGLLGLRRTQVAAALKPLWSVLHVSELNTAHRVSTLHASFPDYIFNSNRSKNFVCRAQTHNGELAELCLKRIRQNRSQFNICSLRTSYMFDEDVADIDQIVKEATPLDLLYACQYWAIHISLGGTSDASERTEALRDFLGKRLLLWMEVLNLTKRIDIGIRQMERFVTWLQTTNHAKSTMLLAQDARRFVIMFATSPVSRSTPHLYVSMLSTWPEDRPMAHCYTLQATNLVLLKGIEATERQLALLSLLPTGFEIYCVAYSPNGKLFAAGTKDGRVLVWDPVTIRMTVDPINAHSGTVQSVAISPDGTRMCSGSHDKTICIWDPLSGQLVAGPLAGHTNWVKSVSFSPNGPWLASGSGDGTVRIWSTHNWEIQDDLLEGDSGLVNSVAYSPNGSILAAASESLIHLWDPVSGETICEPLKGHTDFILTLAFLPGGKYLVSGSNDCTICIWNVHTGQLAFGPFREHIYGISEVAVSPDGHFFVSAAKDDTIRIWNTKTWHSRLLFQNTGVVNSVTFSPDGSRLLSGSADGNVRIWEVQEFTDEQVVDSQLGGHSDWVRTVAFSPCGAYLISGSDDMTVCIWDLQTRRLRRSLLKHDRRILMVGASADGEHIFSVSEDRMIHVWSEQTGELEYAIGPIETDGAYDSVYQELWPVAFLFDGNRVVCGSKSGKIYMQDGSEPIVSLSGHNAAVYSIAFSPNGQFFASGSDYGVLMIWDASTGDRLFDALTGHSQCINAIAFSPDSTQVASGSDDKTVRLWSSATGNSIGIPLEGHTKMIGCVAFSPSGSQLVSGADDLTVRVWDVASGQSIAAFEGHTDIVLSVAFSPDGTQIVSGSADMTIRLWRAPTQGNSSPSNIDCGHPPELSGNAEEDYRTLHWQMNEDGWVYDTQNRLLLWVPPDIRAVLLRQQNTGLISRQGCIELEFTNARIGDQWETCYKPFPPATGD
ncbi:vegetative incompatibility protein HET-E-1 [Rhizoctonia solani 123E]|uniref:Vegetative incompatibility protein HET-E-1 n=1 Tax=Rhizoctonia solani 123E TaxID=1423351 RepID=A0A074RNF0_9AGAM|nr:vegetative incompatibility protein HET-E-1 [Rhizoctonia solani 123E]